MRDPSGRHSYWLPAGLLGIGVGAGRDKMSGERRRGPKMGMEILWNLSGYQEGHKAIHHWISGRIYGKFDVHAETWLTLTQALQKCKSTPLNSNWTYNTEIKFWTSLCYTVLKTWKFMRIFLFNLLLFQWKPCSDVPLKLMQNAYTQKR